MEAKQVWVEEVLSPCKCWDKHVIGCQDAGDPSNQQWYNDSIAGGGKLHSRPSEGDCECFREMETIG